MNSHILLGTSVYKKNHRQDLAVEALIKLKKKFNNIDICLIQQPQDRVEYSNIDIKRTLTRNSQTIFPNNKTLLPFVNDIFQSLSDNSTERFLFVNSDVIISPTLIERINNMPHLDCFAVSRIDIPQINSLSETFTPIRMEPAGFDCWVFSKQWWETHRNLFKDFFLGRPYFDVHYAITMWLNSVNEFINREHLVYHIMHKRQWEDKDEFYKFNQLQMEKNYLHTQKIWGEISNETYLKRRDWGRFLQINSDEEEILSKIKNAATS